MYKPTLFAWDWIMTCLIVVNIVTPTYAAYPECTYMCDNPVCQAICVPECDAPVCTTSCTNDLGPNIIPCITPQCIVQCPPDQSASDNCPTCQILCEALSCLPEAGLCETQCSPPVCTWRCSKPSNCPPPTCQLMCEHPACESPPLGLPITNSCYQQASVMYDVNCQPTRTCTVAIATGMSSDCIATQSGV